MPAYPVATQFFHPVFHLSHFVKSTLARFWNRLRGKRRTGSPRLYDVDYAFPYTLVDTAEGLRTMVSELDRYPSCAMDTEADSMHHYSVRLCLIQITAGEHNWIVDPLCGLDLTPLWKCRAVKNVVFHGADYDLRMLGQTYGFYPEKIYDTMIAAKFLGEERLGLANLVEKQFGRKLMKENQKADWTRRPLPDHMCAYACMDTVYLDAIQAEQTERLRSAGKIAWLEQSCAHLLESSRVPRPHAADEDPWRIRGANKLRGVELQLLKSLWHWRESEAEKLDRPPYKVANPDLMLAIAQAAALCESEITTECLPKLPRNFVGPRLESFLQCLQEAKESPESSWPKRIKLQVVPPPSPDANLLEHLRELRDQKAVELGFDTAMLANRNQLIALAMPGHPDWEGRYRSAGFLPWQCEVWNDILASV